MPENFEDIADQVEAKGSKKHLITITEQKYRFLDHGTYHVMLIKVQDGIGKAKRQPVFNLDFEVLEGAFSGEVVRVIANQNSTGVNGKLWKIIRGLSDRSLEVHEQMMLSDLIGKTCYVNVEKRENSNGKTINDITEFIPVREFEDIKRLRSES